MVEIVAEAGLNHGGNLTIAKKMIYAARAADVGAIKFQTYIPKAVVHKEDKNFKLLESLAFSHSDFIELARFCEEMEIEFLSTPGDVDSLKFLVEKCGIKRIKIGSDDLTYEPLIAAAAHTSLPLILSTGMATLVEIDKVLQNIHGPVTLLHCVSLYPCPPKLANLLAIRQLQGFGCPVGYSDHVPGWQACLAAVTLGATIIEKHFMLSWYDGIDAAVSINELELAELVTQVRITELMLGDGIKQPSPEEAANIPLFRKQNGGLRKCVQ